MKSLSNPVDLANRRYIVQLLLAMIAYVAILLASIELLKTHAYSPGLRAMIAVTPAFPMFAVVYAVVRYVQSVDELIRQVHLEALAISAGITAALAITYTFLEGVGFPHSQAWWAFVSIDLFWAVSLPFVKRRYV
jgi:O-antigen/teichoic acid export membrane protein